MRLAILLETLAQKSRVSRKLISFSSIVCSAFEIIPSATQSVHSQKWPVYALVETWNPLQCKIINLFWKDLSFTVPCKMLWTFLLPLLTETFLIASFVMSTFLLTATYSWESGRVITVRLLIFISNSESPRTSATSELLLKILRFANFSKISWNFLEKQEDMSDAA